MASSAVSDGSSTSARNHPLEYSLVDVDLPDELALRHEKSGLLKSAVKAVVGEQFLGIKQRDFILELRICEAGRPESLAGG
jgi:hypothetical protein